MKQRDEAIESKITCVNILSIYKIESRRDSLNIPRKVYSIYVVEEPFSGVPTESNFVLLSGIGFLGPVSTSRRLS